MSDPQAFDVPGVSECIVASNMVRNRIFHNEICISKGFSSDSKSAVRDSCFWAGTQNFQENLTKLHCRAPTFLKKCHWTPVLKIPVRTLLNIENTVSDHVRGYCIF